MIVEATAELARREIARRSVPDFFDYVFQHQTQPFQRLWHETANNHMRAGFVAPRDHGKTSQMAIARTLFELGKDPNLRIKIVTAADDKAADILFEITRNIETCERLKRVFPGLKAADKGSWSKHKIVVERSTISKDVSVESRGIMSTATGGRADLLIFDDPVDFNNAIRSPSQRETVKEGFRSVWTNLLEPWGRAIYIGTAWHEGDLMHELLENPEWYFTVQRIQDTPDSEMVPLWPCKWGVQELKQRKREIGQREFDRQFNNRALSPDEAVFSCQAIENSIATELWPLEVDSNYPRYIGVDLAIGKGEESAYTVIFVLAVDPKGVRIPVEIRRFKKRFPDQVKAILDAWRLHKPVAIYVENNSYQEAMVQQLSAEDASIPVRAFTTGRQKADPYIGLPSLAIQFENGGWRIPLGGQHGTECGCGFCVWLSELKYFPIAKYSDTVMACWFSEAAARDCPQSTGCGAVVGDYVSPFAFSRSEMREWQEYKREMFGLPRRGRKRF
jgi:hypothetical protein